MKQFFTSLRNIKLTNFDVQYLELIPGVNISNNEDLKNKILSPKNKEWMGKLEVRFFESSNVFLFYNYENDANFFKKETDLESLDRILLRIDDVFKNLWLIKDNSVLSDTSFLIDDHDNFDAQITSSRLQYQFANSKGTIDDTSFSKKELIEFCKYHDIIEKHFDFKKSTSSEFMLEKNFSRINRGLIYVKQAREARNIAYKISNYCSALEALFSTDNVELSHKLSERIAFFLKENFNTLETFKTIKKSYGIRSKLTHGDTLENKQLDTLLDLSTKIDDILRFSINKIIKDESLLVIFESPKSVIDQYFEKLIFE